MKLSLKYLLKMKPLISTLNYQKDSKPLTSLLGALKLYKKHKEIL